MRIDFSPRLQYGIGENPTGGGLASAAMGATPWGAIAQAGLGLVQTGLGFFGQKKATKELEKMQSPTYTANKGILDYYNKSLAKYNVNPYNTDLYRMQEKMSGRNLASGLSALQGRGQALAGVNDLVSRSNDSMLKAGAQAEDLQRQDLSRLGNAASMKAGEEQNEFNINKQQPFERKYNLKALKASGGVDVMNSGISNIFSAGNSYQQGRYIDKTYGK